MIGFLFKMLIKYSGRQMGICFWWRSRQGQVVRGGERMSAGSVSTSLLSCSSFQR